MVPKSKRILLEFVRLCGFERLGSKLVDMFAWDSSNVLNKRILFGIDSSRRYVPKCVRSRYSLISAWRSDAEQNSQIWTLESSQGTHLPILSPNGGKTSKTWKSSAWLTHSNGSCLQQSALTRSCRTTQIWRFEQDRSYKPSISAILKVKKQRASPMIHLLLISTRSTGNM